MATRTVAQLAPTNSSDALFSAWVNEIYNALIAFGWVQVMDSGTTTFGGTLTAPSGINTYPNWGIFRMDDSLQSTYPVVMRIDFGEAAVADTPSILVTVAMGTTDGAGNLIGPATTQVSAATGSKSGSATAASCYTSGSTSSFRMHFWGSELSNTPGWTLVVERERTTAGVEAGTGVHVCFHWNFANNNTQIKSQFLGGDGSIGSQESVWYALISSRPTQVSGGIVGVAPVRSQLGPFRQPMIGLILGSRTDFVANQTYPLTIYGATHRYKMLRPNFGTTAPNLNSINADTGFGLLWE